MTNALGEGPGQGAEALGKAPPHRTNVVGDSWRTLLFTFQGRVESAVCVETPRPEGSCRAARCRPPRPALSSPSPLPARRGERGGGGGSAGKVRGRGAHLFA